MKILAVNKFYRITGGSDRVFFNLTHLLETHGHQVIPFAMQHEHNLPTPYARFFVSKVDFFEQKGLLERIRSAERVLYSLEARDKIGALVEEVRPDIAHLHIICHQISPSILPVLKSFGLPVVQTLHEYKRICPTYSLVSHGEICERCKGHRYYHAALRRCNHGSMSASLLNAVEMYLHKALRIYERNIDCFITPSDFMRRKMIEFGMNGDRIVHVPNFVDPARYTPSYERGNYFAFVGRLIKIKGVQTLLAAMKEVRGAQLYVVGEGELRSVLERYAAEAGLLNVRFLGYQSGEALQNLIRNSLFTVIPSEWYENCPMTVLESLAMGKPVVGARIGGIPELIEDGVDGLLFESGNATDLADKLNWLLSRRGRLTEMGKAGRAKTERELDAVTHYERIMNIYERIYPAQVLPSP